MSEPNKAVFLSYASQDAEAARRICEALRAGGIEVWFDQSELRGGDAWDQKIRQQIRDCALFIPIISANSQVRSEGYFRLEWRIADQRTHLMGRNRAFLMPVCIDDTRDADADIPESFSAVQWTRLPAGETSPAFVARVSQLLSPSEPQTTMQARPPTGSDPSVHPSTPSAVPSRRSKLLPLLIAAVVLLGIGYTALDKFVLSKRVPAGTPPSASPVRPVARVQSTAPEKSIAVLPFIDMSEKKDQEYFADGMAEEILDVLTKIPGLHVIGRTSSFQFKGKNLDLRDIGTTLGAAHLVEGSVRRSAAHVRVTAKLIRAADGVHEWSASYDRDAGDVLKMQQEIAESLARALQVTVEAGAISSSELNNPAAYDLFLQGLQVFDRFDKAGLEEAANAFQQALNLDPSLARAADFLALTQFMQADMGFFPAQVGFERARKSAGILLERNPRSVYGHAIMSRIHTDYDWDWINGKRDADEAVAINPRFWYGFFALGNVESTLGQWGDAERDLRAALSVDPLNPDTHQALGTVLYGAGRFADATVEYRRALEISPSNVFVHYQIACDLLALGQPDKALREMDLESIDGPKLAGLAMVYHALRRKSDSDAAIEQLTRKNPDRKAYEIALAHAFRGETDQAFKWFDRAYLQKDYELTYIKSEWLLRSLRSDRRYKALLSKMKLPE